jgi:hypothetical protein
MKCLIKDLGVKRELLGNTFNHVLVELIVIHFPIDGCLSFHRREVHLKAVDRLDVVNPQCVRLCFIIYATSLLQSVFSQHHSCAAALMHGKVTPLEFSAEIYNDLHQFEIELTLRPMRY